MVTIRPAATEDQTALAAMRQALWPDLSPAQSGAEVAEILAHEEQTALLATTADGKPIGFIEVSLRPIAAGCGPGPIGYIEGWYVAPELRRQGVGARLVAAAEAWAAARGCREMASDVDIANTVSADAHQHLGYAVVERVVLFRKALRETMPDR